MTTLSTIRPIGRRSEVCRKIVACGSGGFYPPSRSVATEGGHTPTWAPTYRTPKFPLARLKRDLPMPEDY